MKRLLLDIRELVWEHVWLLVAMSFCFLAAYCTYAAPPRTYEHQIESNLRLVEFKGHEYVLYPNSGILHFEDCPCQKANRVLGCDAYEELEKLRAEVKKLKAEKEQ